MEDILLFLIYKNANFIGFWEFCFCFYKGNNSVILCKKTYDIVSLVIAILVLVYKCGQKS